MDTNLYHQIKKQISVLTDAEKTKLLEELSEMLRKKNIRHQRDIFELRGLGKEIWSGVDAQNYIEKERKSWNP